jgi:8-hydroxy-5-deazaflavin:NADPH oxidoreductase
MTAMTFDWAGLPDVSGLIVGILGGTGEQGRGLAYRLARAGQPVVVGSRSAERAAVAAAQIAAMAAVRAPVSGAGNAEACSVADIVIVAVPWDGHAQTLASMREALSGKLVVDCVNPLGFDQEGPYAVRVPEGSAAEQAESLLPFSRVCAAFHHLSAVRLMDPGLDRVELDVMVLGNDREAVGTVIALANRIDGMRGVYAGRLRNAGQVEALTANIIAVNRRYRAHAGLRLIDV